MVYIQFPWYWCLFLPCNLPGSYCFCQCKWVLPVMLYGDDLLLLENAMVADILLNSDWGKDLPEDPTGRFHDFKEFVKSNFDIFKWIGIWVILAQGSSGLLATWPRALGPKQSHNYDSEDEFPPARLPLINHQAQPMAYAIGDPQFATKNGTVKPPTFAWNTKNEENIMNLIF